MARRPQRLKKLELVFVFLLPLLLFICSMFPCKYCPEGFNAVSAKGLKQHQKKCQAHLNHDAAANERRKAAVTSKNVRRTKLKERKERLDPLAATAPGPGVSFCDF